MERTATHVRQCGARWGASVAPVRRQCGDAPPVVPKRVVAKNRVFVCHTVQTDNTVARKVCLSNTTNKAPVNVPGAGAAALTP